MAVFPLIPTFNKIREEFCDNGSIFFRKSLLDQDRESCQEIPNLVLTFHTWQESGHIVRSYCVCGQMSLADERHTGVVRTNFVNVKTYYSLTLTNKLVRNNESIPCHSKWIDSQHQSAITSYNSKQLIPIVLYIYLIILFHLSLSSEYTFSKKRFLQDLARMFLPTITERVSDRYFLTL